MSTAELTLPALRIFQGLTFKIVYEGRRQQPVVVVRVEVVAVAVRVRVLFLSFVCCVQLQLLFAA